MLEWLSGEGVLAGLTAPMWPLRQSYYNWGATWLEVALAFPGDHIVENPKYVTTRAIEIDTPPCAIWPWLMQLGQERGGFYTYAEVAELLHLEIHNADDINPRWQQLHVGDEVRFTPEEHDVDFYFEVDEIRPERALVLRTPLYSDLLASWSFVLRPVGEQRTRLVVRFCADYDPTLANAFWKHYAIELPQFALERKMLMGIKERAERYYRQHSAEIRPLREHYLLPA